MWMHILTEINKYLIVFAREKLNTREYIFLKKKLDSVDEMWNEKINKNFWILIIK